MSNHIFVLDTNVLLHDATSIFSFEKGNEVIIPIIVLEELDAFKKRQDEVGRNSRQVTRTLDKLREQGHLGEGVPLPNGGRLRIEMAFHDGKTLPAGFDLAKNDIAILSVAHAITQREKKNGGGRIVKLITKDINLLVKADAVGVVGENFENKAVNVDELYKGSRTVQVTSSEIDDFYKTGSYGGSFDPPLLPNEFVMLQDGAKGDHTALGRYRPIENEVCALAHAKEKTVFGVRALNREQRFALDLLLDDNVPLVGLVGIAGTGKTLLALAAGLEKVVKEDAYNRLLVSKPIMPLGKDIGFLPGDVEEKLMPRMQSLSDNLEFLFMATGGEKVGGDRLQELMEDGVIELEALTYIRGRSIPRQFVIVDEAQNLTPLELKTIITRVGKGSKIVLCGDPYQIDHPYLDSRSNGLTYVIECFKQEPLFGSITLLKGERSELAELAAQKM